MTQKKASRRYMKIMVPSMLVYMVSAFAIAYLRKNTGASVSVLTGLALIPGLAMLTWIWSHWRYISELDEFLQKLQMQGIMVGLGGILAISSVWGVIEEFVKNPNLPAFPLFYIVPLFCFIYGPASMIINKRAGVKGICL